MKLKVLVDNNTYIDAYYLGEPAVCYYIEEAGKKILFDTGYSDVFLKNAKAMEIDLSDLDEIVFSHGHNDHTRGLLFLEKVPKNKRPEIIAHEACFFPKRFEGEEIGSPFGPEELRSSYDLKLSKGPINISDDLVFLGEIPETNSFEKCNQIGETLWKGEWKCDFVKEDSALVYKGVDGLFIITGCSHSGICNIISYAMKVCKETRIAGVLGGFHLFHTDERLAKTISYLKENQIKELYPCHCVSFAAKAKIQEQIPVKEVGVGLTIEKKGL